MTLKTSRLLLALGTAVVVTVVGVGEVHAQDAGTPAGRFEILRFEVTGNTLLAQPALDQLLARYTGKARDFGDVQRAQDALEAAYRAAGYQVVQVVLPEQELNQGVVQFKVIEKPLGKVTVEGNSAFDEANIRRSLPGLRAGQTPNLSAISRSLKVANENPAKKTTLQLQSAEQDGEKGGGEINANLKVVDEKPWNVGVSIDNTGDANTGRNRLTTQLQHANVGGLDHVASLQYTTSMENPGRVRVYGAGYHIPLYALGDSLDFFASYSNVDSGTVSAGLLDLAVSGKGSTFGARYNRNFNRVGDYESKLVFGLDHKAFKNNVSLAGVQLGNDITVNPLSLTYNGNWLLNGATANFYLTGAGNISGGDHGGAADFERVRTGASDSYTLVRYGASYSRALAGDWQVHLSFNGQATRDALVPGEQFGAGGAATVRGFQEREVASDSGRVANLELYSPNWCAALQGVTMQCRLLGFYDSGYVKRNNPLPGEEQQASIGSVGLGVRGNIDKYLTLQMDYGRVVDAASTRAKGEHRLHFRLALSY